MSHLPSALNTSGTLSRPRVCCLFWLPCLGCVCLRSHVTITKSDATNEGIDLPRHGVKKKMHANVSRKPFHIVSCMVESLMPLACVVCLGSHHATVSRCMKMQQDPQPEIAYASRINKSPHGYWRFAIQQRHAEGPPQAVYFVAPQLKGLAATRSITT